MTQTLCLKCMKRFLDIIPQQSPTLPRNCNINTFIRCTYAKISRTRIKTEKQSNASGYTQKFCLCEITFNNSIIFFLYLCHRLCLRFVKCASVTNIINLMHGTVSLAHSLLISKKKNASSLLLKGELQSQLLTFVTNGKMFRISSETSFHQRAKFSSSAYKSREVLIGEVFSSEQCHWKSVAFFAYRLLIMPIQSIYRPFVD